MTAISPSTLLSCLKKKQEHGEVRERLLCLEATRLDRIGNAPIQDTYAGWCP